MKFPMLKQYKSSINISFTSTTQGDILDYNWSNKYFY